MTNNILKPVYKLRNKNTGLFKTAGAYGGWNATGKTWSSKGALSGHFALYGSDPRRFENVEVIVIEPSVKEVMSVTEYLNKAKKVKRVND